MSISKSKIISFHNIGVTFPTKDKEKNVEAVKNVSFDIYQGEVFGIIGTSGAGKSTLLRTINLLQKPSRGQVLVDGQEINDLKNGELRKLRVKIGMIFQHFNLINAKTVYENVAFAMRAVGVRKAEINKRVPEVIELVGLTHRISAYPAKLSGGEKQRVGIARALANNPGILLCDEPTSSLDLDTTNSILDLLKDINRNMGITTVIISHQMETIKKICDRVAVMNMGEIVELDNVFNIFTTPKYDFTKNMVNTIIDINLSVCLLHKRSGQKVLKIVYSGEKAYEGVISETVRKYDVNLTILHGKIEYIADKPFGILIVALDGEKTKEAESFLRTRTYNVEEIYD
jgi:D-methionine transport system ATP-binding protein